MKGGNPVDQIMTASEVATLLQVHIRTVYRLADRGMLPGSRIGRGWRFRKEEILALLSNQKQGDAATEGPTFLSAARSRSMK